MEPESDDTKAARQKHGAKLKTIKELFPAWTDEDLLGVLAEANGDLETSITRISEGQLRRPRRAIIRACVAN